MSTETPLTDADVARLVALADAATRPDNPHTCDFMGCDHTGPGWENVNAFHEAANPATIKALAARLDALHAENKELKRRLDALRFSNGSDF